MTTDTLQPGDIVEVDRKGRRFHAVFTRKLPADAAPVAAGELEITPLDSRVSYRHASARDVIGIWHANKATRARSNANRRDPA